MANNVKYITLRDPKTNDILVPRMVGSLSYETVDDTPVAPFVSDADTLQGHPASYFAKAEDASSIPSGIITMWSGASDAIPTGWLLCNGENGTPDLRDRFVLGAGGTYEVGAIGGEKEHTLTIDEMPSHNHSYPQYTANVGGGVSGNQAIYSSNTVYTSNTGGDQPHNNMPPYYALCFIMKQ